jgi:hypothetical protein
MVGLRRLTTAVLLIAAAIPASAQVDGSRPSLVASPDSTAAGVRAGTAHANQRGVVRYFGLGVVSVGFIGFAAPFAIDDGDAPQIAVASAGVLLLGLTLLNAGRASVPTALEPELVQHDSSYVHGFREGYRARLGQRRRRAAAVGGVAGTVVGAGALVLLLSGLRT